MNLKQWDVVKLRIKPNDKDEHFAVVISPDDVTKNEQIPAINVLYCSSFRPAIPLEPHQVRLNGEDGMERATVASCIHFYTVTRDKIFATTGRVGIERRRQLARRIVASFRLAL